VTNPLRNGEGDRSAKPSGGEADSRRIRHRTVGADPQNVEFARALRRTMTLPEVLLWQVLRKRPAGLKFRKQFLYRGYVVDFACLERRLAIEVDGEAHDRGDRPRRDDGRAAFLRERGYRVLRIAAGEVLKDPDGVAASIVAYAADPLHHRAARGGPPPRPGEDL